MKGQEKHCNTCASSYYQEEKNVNGGKDMVRIDHVDGVTLAISNDMGVLLRKMLENLEEYDDPPVLTRVEKTISGFLFAYGGRDNQEDGPCVVYIVSETPVLPAKNKEEMK